MSKSTRVLVVLLATIYFVSTAVLYVRQGGTNSALSANVNAQVQNRAANVRSWCGGINGSRDYDRAFVRRVTQGQVKYQLHDLDCKALVAKTLRSAQHH